MRISERFNAWPTNAARPFDDAQKGCSGTQLTFASKKPEFLSRPKAVVEALRRAKGEGPRIPAINGCIRTFALLLLFFLPLQTLPCDDSIPWESHFESANVIFVATCMDVSPNPIKGDLNVVFKVDSSWKRKIEPVATVHTETVANGGYGFLKGKRYLVWATKRHQTLQTSGCLPNADLDTAGDQLARLGPGIISGTRKKIVNMMLVMGGMGLLALIFVAFVVLRKRFR